jgi:hypothetical protein
MGKLCLVIPLCEGHKPPELHVLPCVALNGRGGGVAETPLDLRTA